VNVASEKKIQMSGRYPESLVDEAHDYARRHRLHLNVVLAAAVAEYLAKRRVGSGDPSPQLHYVRGHASAESIRLREQLMRIEPRGRKLHARTYRAKSDRDGYGTVWQETSAADPAVAHDAADGDAAGRASDDLAQVRKRRSRARRVRYEDGQPLALAR
jgi:hypothetical protein